MVGGDQVETHTEIKDVSKEAYLNKKGWRRRYMLERDIAAIREN